MSERAFVGQTKEFWKVPFSVSCFYRESSFTNCRPAQRRCLRRWIPIKHLSMCGACFRVLTNACFKIERDQVLWVQTWSLFSSDRVRFCLMGLFHRLIFVVFLVLLSPIDSLLHSQENVAGDTQESKVKFSNGPANSYDSVYRVWTDASGNYKIRAKFLDLAPNDVVILLRENNGETVKVNLDILCLQDRQLIDELIAKLPPKASSDIAISALVQAAETAKGAMPSDVSKALLKTFNSLSSHQKGNWRVQYALALLLFDSKSLAFARFRAIEIADAEKYSVWKATFCACLREKGLTAAKQLLLNYLKTALSEQTQDAIDFTHWCAHWIESCQQDTKLRDAVSSITAQNIYQSILPKLDGDDLEMIQRQTKFQSVASARVREDVEKTKQAAADALAQNEAELKKKIIDVRSRIAEIAMSIREWSMIYGGGNGEFQLARPVTGADMFSTQKGFCRDPFKPGLIEFETGKEYRYGVLTSGLFFRASTWGKTPNTEEKLRDWSAKVKENTGELLEYKSKSQAFPKNVHEMQQKMIKLVNAHGDAIFGDAKLSSTLLKHQALLAGSTKYFEKLNVSFIRSAERSERNQTSLCEELLQGINFSPSVELDRLLK